MFLALILRALHEGGEEEKRERGCREKEKDGGGSRRMKEDRVDKKMVVTFKT